MAVAFVNGGNTTAVQSSMTTGWSVAAGNLVLVCVYDDSGNPRTVTGDNQSNSYSFIGGASGYWCSQNIYACIAGSTGVLTVNLSGNADVVAITEWSGVQNVLDVAGTSALGNSFNNTCSITTVTAGDLIVGSLNINYYGGTLTETGTNVVYYHPVANKGCIVSWQTGAAGTYTFNTQETSGGNNSLCLVALKAAAGASFKPAWAQNVNRVA